MSTELKPKVIVYYDDARLLQEFKEENHDNLNDLDLIYAFNETERGIRLQVLPLDPPHNIVM